MCILLANQVQSCRIQQPFTEQTEFLKGGSVDRVHRNFFACVLNRNKHIKRGL